MTRLILPTVLAFILFPFVVEMVIVAGLDRTDQNPFLSGMSDELWSEHNKEIQEDFKVAQAAEPSIDFANFCKKYAEGTATTKAMIKHASTLEPKQFWPEVLGKDSKSAVEIVRREREDLSSVDVIADGYVFA
mmetsp:Transcript_12602/g.16304  ORF Transcript_12602/g.16304 Transcript_12602/m.16304 type:complete len:133 (-) Transcript_12602:986-1384(-)